jgi:hypothetical protein
MPSRAFVLYLFMTTILIPQVQEVRVRCDGPRVLLILGGRLLLDLPWDAAIALSRAIYQQAKRAEELAKAEQIVMDQALVTRLGLPFGLSSHPVILDEACKEAAWNRDLRRYIPAARAKGIESQSVVGEPTVIRHPPGGQHGEDE